AALHQHRQRRRTVDLLHPDVRQRKSVLERAGNVLHTLFDGGTLRYRQRAAEAAFEQAAAQYRGTVLSAFQNVADALHALQSDAETLKAAVAAEQATKVSLDLTLAAQQLGGVSYLAVLTAQQAYRQALLTRVQAQATRLPATAALFQTLGGGWWSRSEREAAMPEEVAPLVSSE